MLSFTARKRLCQWLVLVFIVFLALESTAALVLLLRSGTWNPWQSIWSMQQAVLVSGGVTSAAELAELSDADSVRKPGRITHPYLGFVRRSHLPEKTFGLLQVGTGTSVLKRSNEQVLVGIIGGSVALGQGIHEQREGSLRTVLQKHPEFMNKHIRVVNFAIAGMKQPQQLLYLSYLLSLGAELDILINLDGFNEMFIAENLAKKRNVFPVYPEIWKSRMKMTWDTTSLHVAHEVFELRKKRVWLARLCHTFPLHFSPSIQLLWSVLDTHWQNALVAQESVLGTKDAADLHDWQQYVAQGTWHKQYEDRDVLFPMMADVWMRSSIAMGSLAKAHGIRYYHFLQPNQYLPNSKSMREEERKIAIDSTKEANGTVPYAYSFLTKKVDALRNAGITFYDMTGVFHDTLERTYGDTCCHLSGLGQRILNEAMGNTVVDDLSNQ